MATSAGAVVAAAVAGARREVREHFEAAGAFSLESAACYVPPTHFHERQLELLIGQGILKETGSGRFWIDREAAELEAQRRKRALKTLLVITLAGVVIAAVVSMAPIRVGWFS